MRLRLWLLPEPPLRLPSTAIDVMSCHLSEMRESWVICAEGLKQSAYSYKTILMMFKCFNLYVTIAVDS